MNEAEKILDEARAFMAGRRSATWADYEHFKQELICAECYGYERELADILKL